MTDEQGEQPADQQERSAADRAPADPGAATGDSGARGERPGGPVAGEGGADGPSTSDPAGAFFAAQADLTGRPAAELAAESAGATEPGVFVDGEGRRGYARHVGPAEVAAVAARTRPARLDPVSAVAFNEAHVRRCGFSRCRKPLPDEQRAGKKSEYCSKDVTSWEVEPGVLKTCGQMARSERDLAAVIRLQTGADAEGPVGVPDLDVVELGELVDTAIPAVQAVLGPITSLLDGLGGVRAQLAQDVAAAHAARDTALQEAATEKSNAATARQVAVDAEAAKAAAETRAETAEDAARRDRLAKERAEKAEERAEGRVTELQDNLERADERIEALAEKAEKAAGDLARTEGELTAARAATEEQKQRAEAQAERANAAVAQAAELERTLREEFAAELERRAGEQQRALDDARADFDQRLEQARREFNAAVEQVREQAESARDAERRAHADQIGQLHQQLGGLTQRAETAETARREQAGLVRALRAALARTITLAGEDDVEDRAGRLAELRREFRALLEEVE
ncbi:hypothetical protein [Amycolatopsis sp. cg9]|uniref:hypothetical protein n=1 Tax=Amycolatopsis sp. cg9 TaxID=3238801 RepID=UPI0035240032